MRKKSHSGQETRGSCDVHQGSCGAAPFSAFGPRSGSLDAKGGPTGVSLRKAGRSESERHRKEEEKGKGWGKGERKRKKKKKVKKKKKKKKEKRKEKKNKKKESVRVSKLEYIPFFGFQRKVSFLHELVCVFNF